MNTSHASRTTVIYHSADFDGIFCREITRKFLPEDTEFIGWNFGDPSLLVPSGRCYILDLPVDRVFGFSFDEPETIPPAFSAGGTLPDIIWIDHHKTSIDTHPASIPGYRIDGVAACRLAWQWFVMAEKSWKKGDGAKPPNPNRGFYTLPEKQDFIDRNVSEPLAVRLAGEYDIWDKRDPDAELFQHGLRSQEITPRYWAALFGDGTTLSETIVYGLLANGRCLQYAKANENTSIISKNGFTIRWEGLTFLACNASHYNSHLFTAGIKPEHDGLLGFCLRSNGKWSVSLYGVPGKPDIDFSPIAKKHGGGGHRQACGFECEELPFPIRSTTFQERVVEEKRALDVKIEKLTAFRSGPVCAALTANEQLLLANQLDAMTSYSVALAHRLEGFLKEKSP
jgi:uncharacterized protein